MQKEKTNRMFKDSVFTTLHERESHSFLGGMKASLLLFHILENSPESGCFFVVRTNKPPAGG